MTNKNDPDLKRRIEAGEVCVYEYNRNRAILNLNTMESYELSCKSWRCPKHSPKWLHKWRVIVAMEIERNPIDRLITLTCASQATPQQLNRAMQLFCRDVRKRYDDFQYFAVLEFTSETRLPHLHILARCDYLPQDYVSNVWAISTKQAGIKPSPIVYVEKPRSQSGSALYALKYALDFNGKRQDIPESYRGRKITYSKGFFEIPTKDYWSIYLDKLYGVREKDTLQVVLAESVEFIINRLDKLSDKNYYYLVNDIDR